MRNLKTLFLLLLFAGILDIGRYFFYPDINDLKKTRPIPTAFMEYRQNEWAEQNREIQLQQKWVGMSQISPNVIKAVLIGEDDKFWKHDGFDVKGMEQALERSIKKGKMAGGSTISQQLSKNLYLSPSKNPVRKIKEAIITWRIEHTLSKRRILEIYLNVAEWGDGIFGIEAAARHYYHKSAKNLSGYEAARLAAVLPNPIRFDPTGDQKYVKNRARVIYKIMKRRGIIIPEYKEVMTPPKPSEQNEESPDNNDSVLDLFENPSIQDTRPVETQSDIPASDTQISETNGSSAL